MAILLNANSKVIVQGMTGSEGKKHTERMIKSGTKIVGGVTPGKGGQSLEVAGQNVPVFNSVQEAMAATSSISIPPATLAIERNVLFVLSSKNDT